MLYFYSILNCMPFFIHIYIVLSTMTLFFFFTPKNNVKKINKWNFALKKGDWAKPHISFLLCETRFYKWF
jgi:hypothetical protein